MTPEELSGIYYINKEIAKIQQEITELKNKNFYRKNIITDMPRGGGGRDEFAEYMEDVRTLESMLAYSLKKLQLEKQAIEDFLQSVEDPELRLIMRLRAVNNMKWGKIGNEVNMDRRTVSRKFYSYFESCPQCDIGL